MADMFNFLKEKKQELIVRLDRPDGIYHPGETVNISLDIQPKNKLELVGVQVKLRGFEGRLVHGSFLDSNTYDYISTAAEGMLSNCTEFFAKEEKVLDEITLPGGTLWHYSFQMTIPSDASPSFVGEDRIVQWQVIVKLMGRYLEKEWLTETGLSVQLPQISR
jgi:hypothetical protein